MESVGPQFLRRLFRTIVVLSFALAAIAAKSQNLRPVGQGRLDLRQWNMQQQPVISLNGEWSFYWNQLIQWSDIQIITNSAFINFSRPWNEQFVAGKHVPSLGYATYAAEVFLPAVSDSLALEVPAVYNSYSLWINDKLVCSNGRVGKSKSESIPMWKPLIVRIAYSDTLHIIFQVSNFRTARGGPVSPIRLGLASKMFPLQSVYATSTKVLIGVFLLVGLSFLLTFFISFRKMFLYFSGLALAFATRFLFSDQYPYYDFGIHLPWEVAAKIEYISIPFMVTWGVLFIAHIYPLEFRRIVKLLFLTANGLLIIVTVLVAPTILTYLLIAIQIVALSFLLYVIYVIIKALIFERVGAWLSVAGIIIFTLAAIYNLLAIVYFNEFNRIIVHACYTLALVLNAISLWYRTPIRIKGEEQNILRYSDLYSTEEK